MTAHTIEPGTDYSGRIFEGESSKGEWGWA